MSRVHSDFLKADIDLEELSAVIAKACGTSYRLTPLNVKCTFPVFRGECDGRPPAFVKVGTADEWQRTSDVLKEVGDSGFFARFLVTDPLEYKDFAVFVTEWRESTLVRPEDMTESQVDAFVANCVRMSEALQKVSGVADIAGHRFNPEKLYDVLAQYSRRHPFVSRWLKGLLDIPVEQRTLGSRKPMVVHGDFHSKNFGFQPDGGMHVCDFDKMMTGFACGDLANALIERFSCLGLPKSARERLKLVTKRAVSKSPWPREDFVAMCNVLRLKFAAHRIEKHPDSAWIVIDILRRDRCLREFLECL